MKAYINGTGNVSPQKTWDSISFLDTVAAYDSRMIQCLEPDMDAGLDDKYLRRMSRLIRLGWLASKICLEDAGNQEPDAIITGSGWGSVLDSEKFLLTLLKNKEGLLPPTPFIQSTHNVVGAQIAMLLNNSSYNMTYAHSSFAFEHALADSLFSMESGEYRNILLGGFDEITGNQFILTDRLGRWRKKESFSLRLIVEPGEGSIAGEGFTFFFLQDHHDKNTYAVVKDVMTLFSSDSQEEVVAAAADFLARNGLGPGMTDWAFAGYNGDRTDDRFTAEILSGLFPGGISTAAWKHLSGEYLTSSAFATWAAAKTIRHGSVPEILSVQTLNEKRPIHNILIYNHFKRFQHSFILISFPE